MYDYIIVGGGLSGSSFADLAKKNNKKVCIVEQKSSLGGAIRQENIEGITVHKYGPHIFHTNDKSVWDYINTFTDFNGYVNQPIARIDGDNYNLPFNMNTFKQLWGVKTPEEAKEKIEKDKIIYDNPQNLEQFALSSVGQTIYEKFIKKYTEKQWGKPCNELPADFIKRLPIRLTYDNNYFNSNYQGIPINGYNEIIEKQTNECDIIYNKSGTDIDFSNGKAIIYTASIDELFDYCYGKLEWRSIKFETWKENVENYQGCAVMNFTGDEEWTRITEHKHFLNEKSNSTILTKEFPCKWQNGMERLYPLKDDKNLMLYEKYYQKAIKLGIYPLGRIGRYKYLNMDEAIKEAMKLYNQLEN